VHRQQQTSVVLAALVSHHLSQAHQSLVQVAVAAVATQVVQEQGAVALVGLG
jgi:hypothetical protein